MANLNIPEPWQATVLENVLLQVVGGGTPSKSRVDYYKGHIPWMSVKDMNKNVLYDTADHITQEAVENSSTNIIPAGTPIIATRMSLGKIVIASFDSAINQDLKALFLPPDISKGYLIYWYRSIARNIEQLGTGTTVKGIRLEVLKGLDFPLAPLSEQKVIVETLDTLLAQVESIQTRLERVPHILKRFRQSVLAAAVSGKLTEEWRRENPCDSKEQLKSIKELYPCKPPKSDLAKFHELPESWSWAFVREVGSVQLGRQRAPKYHSGSNMRPYLRVANVMEGYIDTSDVMEMDFDTQDFDRYRLRDGDILLNEGQSHELVGRPAIFRNELENVCFTNTLVRFRPHGSISSEFSYMLFLSYLKTGRFQEIASRTVNISHLGAGRFADMEFPFPPFEEQTEIVRRVEQLFAYADTIEQQVNQALARVNNLTQSILARAFSGELTRAWREANPELVSGDNSAEALLARIQAERATQKKTSTKKSRTAATQ
ncbi:restriction endonuclease subunit S [Zobellella aerophila]|uniref:Restriction endonuclease subunit S n=1 Tax=Zobellella aerophila TaxID=870480 RepID=A0ABP6V7D7_9GAMM